MKIAIAGGKLQGIEASYLARKSGFDILLLDKDKNAPAAGLCDNFYKLDVTHESSEISKALQGVDLLIPAMENFEALVSLDEAAKKTEIPFAFDMASYAITSSKKRSNELFRKLGIPAPLPWPECPFPVILKPSGSSGSRGIQKIDTAAEYSVYSSGNAILPEEWIIEEFLDGPSFSLEILGDGDRCVPLQTTLIEVDSSHDCKRVRAPADISISLEKEFRNISQNIAASLNLKGVMDVEVILHDNQLKILEIDARLPSQTPSVVFHSTGINMIEYLFNIFSGKKLSPDLKIINEKAVIYEHINVTQKTLMIAGEHVLANARPLELCSDFFGADEALTDIGSDNSLWTATLILTGKKPADVWNKHHEVINNIVKEYGITTVIDPSPSENIRIGIVKSNE